MPGEALSAARGFFFEQVIKKNNTETTEKSQENKVPIQGKYSVWLHNTLH